MASGKALEEKNLKAIRELMKLPANKTCFDCNQKGPVYANLTIGTFICTPCSGIHRELSHRCKSVSMSTFTSAEVEKLTSVGNEEAAKIWHANWNPSENPAPDSSDVSYLRKFIFMTYRDRAFCAKESRSNDSGASLSGQRSSKKPKEEKPPSSKSSRRSMTELPAPEPLSNILGPNIPSIDVGRSSSNGSSKKKSPRKEAPLINLLDDSPAPASSSSTKSTNDLLGDLASLNFNPVSQSQPYTSSSFSNFNNPQTSAYGSTSSFGSTSSAPFNPFGSQPAPVAAPVPQVDPQQLAMLQNQVQNMQVALQSAQQQMLTCQQRIAAGQANFNQLNQQQREELNALTQRQRAMTQQYAAMTQQYQAASQKLQQLLAASQPAPASNPSTDLFANFQSPASSGYPTTASSGFGGASSTSFGSFGAATSNTQFAPSQAYAPSTSGYASNGLYSSQTQPTQSLGMGNFAPPSYTSPKKNDFDPFG